MSAEQPYPKWVNGSYMLEPVSYPSEGGTRGQIQFIVPAEGQEYFFRHMDGPPADGSPNTNEQHRETEIDILNGRTVDERSQFGLQTTGFILGRHEVPMPLAPSSDDLEGINEWVKLHALPSACHLVQRALGDDVLSVSVFDYTMRFQSPPKQPPPHLMFREPILGAHADFTAKSGPLRMHKILSNEDGQGILTSLGSLSLHETDDTHRIIFVNLWQPLRPVHKRPLAVCDANTIDMRMLHERTFLFKQRTGYTYAVEYSPQQKWYYFPDMTPEEAIMFKVFDSEVPPPEGGPHYATPHTGMKDVAKEGIEHLPPRESVEIRTIVVLKKN